jgi:hypothetical protein
MLSVSRVKKLLTRNRLAITFMRMLNFSLGNAKLRKGEAIFDLPAGHSCPFALRCKSSANKVTGRIKDGPFTEFRCYAASGEARSTAARRLRWHNFNLLRKCKGTSDMASLIANCLPLSTRIRIHSSGDFFSQAYFDAWLMVARQFPERTFYAYTKAIPFWVARLGQIPSNFKLVASYGGTHDALMKQHNLKNCTVFGYKHEAEAAGLAIDTDDSHAYQGDENFALVVHNTQPAGSPMAAAWQYQKTVGHGGYSRNQRKESKWN